jgi:hypothetical protein
VDKFGFHALNCKKIAHLANLRHTAVKRTLGALLKAATWTVRMEESMETHFPRAAVDPQAPVVQNPPKVIADLIVSPCNEPDAKYALDVVVSSYTTTHVNYKKSGDANRAAVARKIKKYAVFAVPDGKLVPMAFETSGAVSKEADAFIKTVMRSRPFTATVDDRGRAQLVEMNVGSVFQRVGTLIQRWNASMLDAFGKFCLRDPARHGAMPASPVPAAGQQLAPVGVGAAAGAGAAAAGAAAVTGAGAAAVTGAGAGAGAAAGAAAGAGAGVDAGATAAAVVPEPGQVEDEPLLEEGEVEVGDANVVAFAAAAAVVNAAPREDEVAAAAVLGPAATVEAAGVGMAAVHE